MRGGGREGIERGGGMDKECRLLRWIEMRCGLEECVVC